MAGETGNLVERALEEEEVQHHFVRLPGQTRINITVVDRTGSGTSFYGPGPAIPKSSWNTLEAIVRFWFQAGRVLVLAESLPPGVSEEVYAEYTCAAHAQGVRVILDADGSAMRFGVAAGPDLIKPNVAEAERLLGRTLPGLREIVQAAQELASR